MATTGEGIERCLNYSKTIGRVFGDCLPNSFDRGAGGAGCSYAEEVPLQGARAGIGARVLTATAECERVPRSTRSRVGFSAAQSSVRPPSFVISEAR